MSGTRSARRDESLALLIDITECVGCRGCVEACMQRRGLDVDPFEVEELSADAYTVVDEVGDWFVRRMCMHCQDPTCASACPVEAIRKTEMGPVIYEARRCLGCRYCMIACPFNVPRYQWSNAVPAVAKCDMCVDRQLRGEAPACVEACPFDAVLYGTREELLEEAHRRIRDNPDDYYPEVYGETEAGGTSVLFLAPVAFEELGFNVEVGDEPLPQLTEKALGKVPDILSLGGAFLLGMWWLTNRRAEVAAAEGRVPEPPAAKERHSIRSTPPASGQEGEEGDDATR